MRREWEIGMRKIDGIDEGEEEDDGVLMGRKLATNDEDLERLAVLM